MNRYRLEEGVENSGAFMERDRDGDYVLFEDVKTLEARAQEAEAERDALREAMRDIADPLRLQTCGDPLVLRCRARAALNRETDT